MITIKLRQHIPEIIEQFCVLNISLWKWGICWWKRTSRGSWDGSTNRGVVERSFLQLYSHISSEITKIREKIPSVWPDGSTATFSLLKSGFQHVFLFDEIVRNWADNSCIWGVRRGTELFSYGIIGALCLSRMHVLYEDRCRDTFMKAVVSSRGLNSELSGKATTVLHLKKKGHRAAQVFAPGDSIAFFHEVLLIASSLLLLWSCPIPQLPAASLSGSHLRLQSPSTLQQTSLRPRHDWKTCLSDAPACDQRLKYHPW